MTIPQAEDIPASNGYPHSESQQEEKPDYSYLFEAPDYASFIKRPTTAKAKDYEKKTASLLKAWLFGAINTGQYADAAAILENGPGFSAAAGQLADADPKCARMLDLITTPSSPLAVFVMATLTFTAQVIRNHEQQLQDVPPKWRDARKARKAQKNGQAPPEPAKPLFTVKLFGRTIGVGKRTSFKLGKFLSPVRAQTSPPDLLVYRVFNDEKVINALHKQGIHFGMARNESD